MTQRDLFSGPEDTLPAKPRFDINTSPDTQEVLREILRTGGTTAAEIADRLGYPDTVVRDAISNLDREGYIVDNLQRRETRIFKHSIVWEPDPKNRHRFK